MRKDGQTDIVIVPTFALYDVRAFGQYYSAQ